MAALLSGCGQKGPLFLPPDVEAPQQTAPTVLPPELVDDGAADRSSDPVEIGPGAANENDPPATQ